MVIEGGPPGPVAAQVEVGVVSQRQGCRPVCHALSFYVSQFNIKSKEEMRSTFMMMLRVLPSRV